MTAVCQGNYWTPFARCIFSSISWSIFINQITIFGFLVQRMLILKKNHANIRCSMLVVMKFLYKTLWNFWFILASLEELMLWLAFVFSQIRGSKLQNRIRYLWLLSDIVLVPFIFILMTLWVIDQIWLACCHAQLCW